MGKKKKVSKGPYLQYAELLRDRVPSFQQFPFSIPSIKNLGRLSFHPQVTFLTGENGTGKSTLLEAIAISMGLNPEGGSQNLIFATRESHSDLDQCVRVAKTSNMATDSFFLRAESFYNVATQIERLGIPAYGARSLHEQSHGESFFALFQYRLRGNGLYLLDEPEAALSPCKQIELLGLIHLFCKTGAQFVIATHSPIIMAYPNSFIYVLHQDGLSQVAYEQTEHFQVTRSFLSNPRKILRSMMALENSDSPD